MASLPRAETATRRLARHILSTRESALAPESLIVARQCVLDWFAVTLAARDEPLVAMLRSEAGTVGPATILGTSQNCSPADAALVNGAASHALDYDDCHHFVGHPTVGVLPAALALAQAKGTSGGDLLRALIAGVEASAAIGSLALPDHYDRGFHATATLGAFGAAAAAGYLIGLDEDQMVMALGLAGTQAAGLKSMFGTMAKPFHAGKAASNGVLAARLAKAGFTAGEDVLDAPQGFLDTQGRSKASDEMRLLAPGAVIVDTLFKYHAACYYTHSTIEALRALREEHGFAPQEVAAIDIHVLPGHLRVCDITEPESGLQVKFSLRHLAAMAVHGFDTASIAIYSEETARAPELVALRRNVTVHPDGSGETAATVKVTLSGGRSLIRSEDVGIPLTDLRVQQARLRGKYSSLTEPLFGAGASDRLYKAIDTLESAPNVSPLFAWQ